MLIGAGARLQRERAPAGTPVRVQLPQRDDGPHLGYAVQWFTVAAVARVGVGTLIAQDVRRG